MPAPMPRAATRCDSLESAELLRSGRSETESEAGFCGGGGAAAFFHFCSAQAAGCEGKDSPRLSDFFFCCRCSREIFRWPISRVCASPGALGSHSATCLANMCPRIDLSPISFCMQGAEGPLQKGWSRRAQYATCTKTPTWRCPALRVALSSCQCRLRLHSPRSHLRG